MMPSIDPSVARVPLAERMRPKTLEGYVGQKHLLGTGKPLRRMIESGTLPSLILWGPPGVGKTTLAELLALLTKAPFFKLSAVGSGVAEVRRVLEEAKQRSQGLFAHASRPILFIDEIHRFSKSQQDSLLSAVEKGVVTLIGATTENPSFEVIRPLLSRSQVLVLKPIEPQEMEVLLQRALHEDTWLQSLPITLDPDHALLLELAGGDARKMLNLLEIVVSTLAAREGASSILINNDSIATIIKEQPLSFDKGGELHYDIASAFIKSIRGSDPQAALYWMARLIEGGEDPRFIARRIIISAAEDIGLANPNALLIANAAAQAVDMIGWPEGRIPLAEAVIYLALSPKSNSAYLAIDRALETVRKTGNLEVPLHLRNAPTELLNKLGYGAGYLYAHDFPNHYVQQQYLPNELLSASFYQPQTTGIAERKLLAYLNSLDDTTNQH